jgi:hypothetical protein
LCGSELLNLAFEGYVRTFAGEPQYSAIEERRRRKMIGDFEIIKCDFSGGGKRYSIGLVGIEHNLQLGIQSETVLVKPYVISLLIN